jgi:hypothetical protein
MMRSMDTTTQPQQTPDAPKTRTRTADKRIEHSAVISMYAEAHPKDPSAKGLRRVLRANRDADKAYKTHQKNAPWPAHSRKVLLALFENDPAFANVLRGKRPDGKPRKGAQA